MLGVGQTKTDGRSILILTMPRSGRQAASMRGPLSEAVLVNGPAALACRCHARRPCPRVASIGRATRLASWTRTGSFAALFPGSERNSLVSVVNGVRIRGHSTSAGAVQNVVSGIGGVSVREALRGALPNSAFQPTVRFASVPCRTLQASLLRGPAAERER